MSNVQAGSVLTLQNLVGSVRATLSESVTGLTGEGCHEAMEKCLGLIETISKTAAAQGLTELGDAAEDLDTALAVQPDGLTLETGKEVIVWLSDALACLEDPENHELLDKLLKPLPARLLAGVLGDEGDPIDYTLIDNINEDIIDDSRLAGDMELDASIMDAENADESGKPEFDTDSMLGMLASELHEISPELCRLADSIVQLEDSAELIEAVGAYQELIFRVSTVSESLGLKGLVRVCEFVVNNTLLVAELAPTQRGNSRQVLRGWSRVVIDHLLDPENDSQCLAVVEYLEKDDWPQPLAYRDVRELIDGLTAELVTSGDFEVEVRETEAGMQDVELELSDDASPELIDAFFNESPGHAEKFSSLMEAIAKGEDIQNNVEAAQRIAHTLKGSGNLVGAKGVANVSHHIEDIFEYIASNKIAPPAGLAHCMQEAADTIEAMLEYLQGMAPYPDEAQRVLQDVLNWANKIDSGMLDEDESSIPEVPLISETVDESRRATDEVQFEGVNQGRRATDAVVSPAEGRSEAIRVPIDVLDNIFRVVGETAIAIGQIQEHLNRLETGNKLIRKNDITLQQRRYELEDLVNVRGMAARHRSAALASGGQAFDPLEMDEYDEFYGITHSYIEGVADSREILRGITEEVSDLNALFLLQKRLNKELQQMVMTTRMVPVKNISARLQRAVRQVSRATGKAVELSIIGEDLLLDGDVLNKLADPLMHMLRNAVDHSVENSSDRFDQGKPEVGNISLSFQQEGNTVVVACADDGRGLNFELIREKAVQKGLISDSELVDDAALARIILQSGFSTKNDVTQVSGRGVGMDVVHNTIQALNGSMDLSNTEKGGAKISLRLPITLLTSHCLLAGVGADSVYAIPTSALAQILSPGIGQSGYVGSKLTYQLDQDVYPLKSLGTLVGLQEDGEINDNNTVLLVHTVDGMIAVAVDSVVSSHDLVVKNMGNYVKQIRGVAGVSTLGDGSVVAVLDISSLVRESAGAEIKRTALKAASPGEKIELPKVLVVDDSLSVRSSLSQLMTDGGYQAITARDGIEAIDLLNSEHPDIVLTDLEMPRMNGLELTSYIRKSDQWSPLPVVMITSRTMAKHRQQADEAGVSQYITKPFTEDDVLVSIGDHLRQP